ncbi:MAG: serine protease [Rhodospirillales bacterium]|nr:serine protease [Rhodospirillales bacterium]
MELLNKNQLRKSAVLTAALFVLVACQTGGGGGPVTSGPQTQAASVSSAPAAPRISRDYYTPFFDEVDHLNELVKAGNILDAERLFQEQGKVFSQSGDKGKVAMKGLADALSASLAPQLAAATANVSQQKWPVSSAAWAPMKTALDAARSQLAAYDSHPVLNIPEFQSAGASSLRRGLAELDKQIEEGAQAHFDAYNHFSGTSFFSAFPAPLDIKSVVKAGWPKLRPALATAKADRMQLFAKAYEPKTNFDPETQKDFAALFVQAWSHSAAGKGKPGLADALAGIRAAEEAGLKIEGMGGLRVGFAEVTSRTLLDKGQIQFPAQIEVDLPIDVDKSELDAVLSEGAMSNLDYLFVIDVALAKATRRAINSQNVRSRTVVGTKSVVNPDWDAAQVDFQQAQSNAMMTRAQSSSYNDPFASPGVNLLGGILNAIVVGAAQGKANDAAEKLKSTPRMIEQPVYADYDYKMTQVAASKTMTVHYYAIDRVNRKYFKSTFDVAENARFAIPYQLDPRDPHKKEIESANKTETDLEAWEKQPSTVKLSQLVDHYLGNAGASKPLPGLASLRTEMLADRNKAIAKVKEDTYTGSTRYDPRFDHVVVINNPDGGLGTGFFVRPDVVMTNHHVIEGAKFVELRLRDGQETFGKVLDVDVRLDLALVRVQTKGKPVKFYNRNELELGSTVDVIGHPRRLQYSISRGVVSAVRKEKSIQLGSGQEVLFVQVDAAISPGNSGGPVFMNNEVVGVVDFTRTDGQNINFAIHYSEAQRFLREALKE